FRPTIRATWDRGPPEAATRPSRFRGIHDSTRRPGALCQELGRTRVRRKRKREGIPADHISQADHFLPLGEPLSDRTMAWWHRIGPYPTRSAAGPAYPCILRLLSKRRSDRVDQMVPKRPEYPHFHRALHVGQTPECKLSGWLQTV